MLSWGCTRWRAAGWAARKPGAAASAAESAAGERSLVVVIRKLLDFQLLKLQSNSSGAPMPRRGSIGQELVAVEGAAVLLLDEPSSGLDSHAALHLMQTLKQVGGHWLDTAGCKLSWAASRSRPRGCCAAKPLMLPAGAAPPGPRPPKPCRTLHHGCMQVARAGRIVLLSCHQPSPPMFALLDRAYLLAGGVCVFTGPPAAVRPRFAALGLPCPAEEAPAEHMLEVGRDGWWSCTGLGSKEDSSVRGGCLQMGGGHRWDACQGQDNPCHNLTSPTRHTMPRWSATRSSWPSCCKRQASVNPVLAGQQTCKASFGARAAARLGAVPRLR